MGGRGGGKTNGGTGSKTNCVFVTVLSRVTIRRISLSCCSFMLFFHVVLSCCSFMLFFHVVLSCCSFDAE